MSVCICLGRRSAPQQAWPILERGGLSTARRRKRNRFPDGGLVCGRSQGLLAGLSMSQGVLCLAVGMMP
jgi:hypothetical protein